MISDCVYNHFNIEYNKILRKGIVLFNVNKIMLCNIANTLYKIDIQLVHKYYFERVNNIIKIPNFLYYLMYRSIMNVAVWEWLRVTDRGNLLMGTVALVNQNARNSAHS